MIEFNVFDLNGKVIYSFDSLKDISSFFNDPNILTSNPPLLIMYLFAKYYRYNYGGINYYLHQTKIDNVNSKIVINYDQL
jgi:hypothetical protein